MKFDPNRRHRHSQRRPGYDYKTLGYCCVTICTQDRIYRFGEVIYDKMVMNDVGRMVEKVWLEIPMIIPKSESIK